MFKNVLIRIIFPAWYKICCLRRTKNQALFIEVRERKISSNFSRVISCMKKEHPDVLLKTYFMRYGSCSRFNYIVRCLKLMPKLAKSKYVFLDESSNIIAALKIKRSTKIIQLWHGCGVLKKFGKSVNANANYYGNEDMFLLSSDSVTWAYEEATGLSKDKFAPIGIPKTDVYFSDSYKKKCEKLREELLAGRNKKIILFAPTYRGNTTRPKDSKGLNLDLMCKNLSQEYIVIAKFHDSLGPGKPYSRCKDFYYDVTTKWTIEEAMGVCDLVVTDYSSLIFEYSLLNKPAIFYAYDFEDYARYPGLYLDYMNEMPGPICESTIEIIKEIKSGGYDVAKMKNFRDKYMKCCDGLSTKRLISLVIGD